MTKPFHYLDNGSTVFPKPKEVLEAMVEFYTELGVNPGRGVFEKAADASNFVENARRSIARFFGGTATDRLIFTANATDSLNLAIFGLAQPGDHVISTDLEHNSVLRPLYLLEKRKMIEVEFLPLNEEGVVSPEQIEAAIRPNTSFVIANHASNVLGTVQDLKGIGEVCARNNVIFVADVAQSAGVLPIDVEEMKIDILCFTGHKSLLGPTGIGGMYVRKEDCPIHPLRVGGSGIASFDPAQPEEFPYRLETGTMNSMGVAGLIKGVRWIQRRGLHNIHDTEMKLYHMLVDGIKDIEGVNTFFVDSPRHQIPVLSVTLDNVASRMAGRLLDSRYGIATRCGCHCAPNVHKSINTYPEGTIRFSIGPLTVEENIIAAINGVRELAGEGEIASSSSTCGK